MPTTPTTPALSVDLAIETLTIDFLDKLDPAQRDDATFIAGQITDYANLAIQRFNGAQDKLAQHNAARQNANGQNTSQQKSPSKPSKLQTVGNPTVSQLAVCLVRLHNVVRIDEGSASDFAQLAVYMANGPLQGTYSTDEADIRRIARRYRPALSRALMGDLIHELLDRAPAVKACSDRDLIAVNNGILDYRTKELLPFTPEVVLLSKSPVDWVPDARPPVIHNDDDGTDWTLDECFEELATIPDGDGGVVDSSVVATLWQIVAAVVRPLVNWNKAAFLFSTTGNNGKGTYCQLLRGITGRAATNIPLADLGKEFYLESLASHSAIIADENDVGVFLDKVGNLKALVTQDMILVNRKNKIPIALRWRGFMVQCLNSLPESKDKSESFYRRQLFVPFRNRFEGVERQYIKGDYLTRKEVLEYALFKALSMPAFYKIDTPDASHYLMSQYQLANDNVREFWAEFADEFIWDIVPNAFLHDLYVAWMTRVNPSGRPLGRNRFLASLRELISDPGQNWTAPLGVDGSPLKLRVRDAMDAPEFLIDDYNLESWMPPGYTNGHDRKKRCTTPTQIFTRGIVRKTIPICPW